MSEEYDIDELRDQLKDYYGTAAFSMNDNMGPMADLVKIDSLSADEVIEEARSCGFID